MPQTRTLLEMRTEARQRAEMENSTFVTDAELTRYINTAANKLYGKLVAARGDAYYATTATTVTVAGTATVALPSAFYKLLLPQVTVSGVPRTLRRLDLEMVEAYGTTTGVPERAMVMGSNLLLRPIPDAVYTITFWYLPYLTQLSADGDTFDGIAGWENYVVLSAAISCLNKEESDTSGLMTELALIETEIQALSGERDHAAPSTIRDVSPLPWTSPDPWRRGWP